jgi:hypothetical protein
VEPGGPADGPKIPDAGKLQNDIERMLHQRGLGDD